MKPSLNRQLDFSHLASAFARTGHVRIEGFLADDYAAYLSSHLRSRTDWKKVISSNQGLVELDRSMQASLTAAQKEALDDVVYGAARSGFQFRYETIRVPDASHDRLKSDDQLAALADWLCSPPVLSLFAQITDACRVNFADAQATAYGPGDFLTGHDDVVPGKNRHAAYVLGLNPRWRLEWGGMLLFHEGQITRGVAPAFNTLDLFRVGKMHSVSEVTRSAPFRRYSVTGWLRER